MFVSSDEMRDHKFKLGETMGEFFIKWQRSRQIQFLRITRFGKVLLEVSSFLSITFINEWKGISSSLDFLKYQLNFYLEKS